MLVEVTEESRDWVAEYARVPSAFRVESRFEALAAPDGGYRLVERPVPAPWLKDYDAHPGYGPAAWARRFDLGPWAFFAARLEGRVVGCAAALRDAPEIWLLDGRRDLALLWDIRVRAEARGRGAGAALFHRVERWAMTARCTELLIETQDVNVPACRFYQRMGCRLGSVRSGAYPDFPQETQFLWWKPLGA